MSINIGKRPYVPPRMTSFSRNQLFAATLMLLSQAAKRGPRHVYELRESFILSPHAWHSIKTLGRLEPLKEDHRPPYMRDCHRIIYTLAYAALAGKTQVFTFPRSPNIHNRRFHTDKVAAVARDIGRQLALNEDLIEAIALGHDLGQPCFGHDGEKALSVISLRTLGRPFKHNLHSLRVVDVLEKKKLTAETRNGIVCHCGTALDTVLSPAKPPRDLVNLTDAEMPYTLEGCVVRVADIIVFLCHDYMDAMHVGILKPEDLPAIVRSRIGTDADDMIGVMVRDLVRVSRGKNYITMSDQMLEARQTLFEFNHDRIIGSSMVQSARAEIPEIIETLFDYIHDKRGLDPQTAIDKIASFTDRQAKDRFNQIRRKERLSQF